MFRLWSFSLPICTSLYLVFVGLQSTDSHWMWPLLSKVAHLSRILCYLNFQQVAAPPTCPWPWIMYVLATWHQRCGCSYLQGGSREVSTQAVEVQSVLSTSSALICQLTRSVAKNASDSKKFLCCVVYIDQILKMLATDHLGMRFSKLKTAVQFFFFHLQSQLLTRGPLIQQLRHSFTLTYCRAIVGQK